jgi:hypothetical protein
MRTCFESSREGWQERGNAALHVSPETIRAWEQGKRESDGPTLRLLEVAEQHPEVFLGKMRKRARRSRVRAESA